MRRPSLAVIAGLLTASAVLADAGPPPPRFVEGASDTRVYAQNLIAVLFALVVFPVAVTVAVARASKRQWLALLACFLSFGGGVILCCAGYLGGVFITNSPPARLRYNRPPPVVAPPTAPETPAEPTPP